MSKILCMPIKADIHTYMTYANCRTLQVLQRVKHLKNKFQRNLTFCSCYKEFMNTLMRNGYAKKSTDSATEGKYWYIPLTEYTMRTSPT